MSAAPGSSRLLRNTVLLFGTRVAILLLAFVLNVAIARALKPEGLGSYGLMVVLAYVFQTSSALGLTYVLPRELGRRPHEAKLVFDAALAIALPAAAVFAALLASTSRALGYDAELVRALDLVGLSLLPGALSQLGEGLFVARGEGEACVVVTTLENVFRCVVSLIALGFGGGLVALAWTYLLSRVLGFATTIWLMRGRLPRVDERALPAAIAALARGLPTFAALYVLVALFFKGDMILLSILRPREEVGIYTAGYRLFDVACLVPSTAASVVYPVLSRMRHVQAGSEARLTNDSLGALLVAVLPIVLVMSFGAPGIVSILYGAPFAATVPVLAILSWALVPYAADTLLGHAMLAADRQRDDVKLVGAGVLANIAVNLVLIPLWGPTGAAIASVISGAVLAGLHVRYVARRLYPVRTHPDAFRALPAALASALFLWWARAHHPVWTLPTAVLLFLAGARLAGAIRPGFVRTLLAR
ncbi:MAG: flippase [bacterium]